MISNFYITVHIYCFELAYKVVDVILIINFDTYTFLNHMLINLILNVS